MAGGHALQGLDVAHGVDLGARGRSQASVWRPPWRWRGWTLISWPRWKTLTTRASARALTRKPIRLPGMEYSALSTSMWWSRWTLGLA